MFKSTPVIKAGTFAFASIATEIYPTDDLTERPSGLACHAFCESSRVGFVDNDDKTSRPRYRN